MRNGYLYHIGVTEMYQLHVMNHDENIGYIDKKFNNYRYLFHKSQHELP